MLENYEKMYKELMGEESVFTNPSILYNSKSNNYLDDDDEEDFLTKEEIHNIENKKEKSLGTVGPADGPVEEELYFKRFRSSSKHKYTQKEMDNMRSSCIGTIVHDFSDKDIYHVSDEERKDIDLLNEISDELQKVKGTYHQVDQWIKAMRTVVKAWEVLERKGNYIHTEKEFFELVARGKIVSNRIILPKLKKMNSYDIDTLINYISNPDWDPANLIPSTETTPDYDDFYYDLELEDTPEYKEYTEEYINGLSDEYIDNHSDDDIEYEASVYAKNKIKEKYEEEQMMRYLTPEDVEYINTHMDNPEGFKVKDINPKLIKGYDKRGFTYGGKKKKKKNKKKQHQIETLHTILNHIQNEISRSDEYQFNRSFLVANSIFEPVKTPKNFFDDIRFEGSWADDEAMELFEIALREEMLKERHPRSRYMTYADQELNDFFKILEDNNVNTLELRRRMNMTDYSTSSVEQKATKKENKKMESALIERITKLNNNDKFKKIVSKAEKALNKQFNDY